VSRLWWSHPVLLLWCCCRRPPQLLPQSQISAVHYDPAASRFPPSSQANISIPAYFPRLRHVFTGRLRSTNETCSCTKTRFRFSVELGQHTVSKTCKIIQALPGGLPDPNVHVLMSMTIPGVLWFYPFVVLSFCRNHHVL
jgi:hypothetical protein